MAKASVKPILEVELKDAGPELFRTGDEVLQWAQKEMQFWSWLTSAQSKNIGLNEDRTNRFIRPLHQIVASSAGIGKPETPNALEDVRGQLGIYAASGLASRSPRAQFIANLRERSGPLVAKAALAEMLGSSWNDGATVPHELRYEVSHGRTVAHFFDEGIEKAISEIIQIFDTRMLDGLT